MRFKITLQPLSVNPIIPINYKYPLSAAIYKILDKADNEYAEFLHETGYQVENSLKKFKLFTFSDLRMKFNLKGDRMYINSNPEFEVSFHLPEAAQHFIKGLFHSQELDIADKKSKASFKVAMVEAMPNLFKDMNSDELNKVKFSPSSPCVAGIKNSKGEYDFISPRDARFALALEYNWTEKLKSLKLHNVSDIIKVDVLLRKSEPKSRLITVKAFTKQQTQIRGFLNFDLEVTGKRKNIEVLYNSGAGVYNSLGMGCLSPSLKTYNL